MSNRGAGGRRPGVVALVSLGLVVTGIFGALLLEDLYRGKRKQEVSTATKSGYAARRSTVAAPLDDKLFKPVPLPKEMPPWEATPENSPPVPEGHIPAWVVKPPPPDPNLKPPPPPKEPPDPMTYTPPMH